MFRSFSKRLRQAEVACAILLLLAIVGLVALAAITRAAGAPIIWSIEIAQLFFVWLCMLAADLAMQQNRHFGLSLLSDHLDPKAQRLVEIANRAVLAALLAFLLFYAWRNAVLMHPRRLGATQMHGSLVHGSMVVGLVLLLRTMLVQTFDIVRGTAPDTKG